MERILEQQVHCARIRDINYLKATPANETFDQKITERSSSGVHV